MISKPIFLDLGSILTRKISPKWGVSGTLFQPCCELARSVILNNPPIVLLYFSTLEASIFNWKMYFFMCFFKATSETHFLWIWSEFWWKFEARWDPKSMKNQLKNGLIFWWFFDGFSAAQWEGRLRRFLPRGVARNSPIILEDRNNGGFKTGTLRIERSNDKNMKLKLRKLGGSKAWRIQLDHKTWGSKDYFLKDLRIH